MNILITNHQLEDFAGTEISTYTLAKYLKKYHHQVTVYSKFTLSKVVAEFKQIGVDVITDINLIKNIKFDIAHIQHNISAYEVRNIFPNLPLIMWVHGIIPFLELPPIIDLNISKYFVNNQEIQKHLISLGIPKNKIIIVRNLIDTELFNETRPINKTPKNALIISNKITPDKELFIKKVLDKLNIKYYFVGKRFNIIPHHNLPQYINQADIVFTMGLGAMESMFCGRIPIIFDNQLTSGNDGMVTSSNFSKIMEHNFSGRAFNKIYNKQDLINEIKKYNYQDSKILKNKVLVLYDSNQQVKKIIDIYQKSISNYKYKPLSNVSQNILYHIINIISETKHHSYYNTIHNDTKTLAKLEENTINNITSSKFYHLWQLYTKIKVFFHK